MMCKQHYHGLVLYDCTSISLLSSGHAFLFLTTPSSPRLTVLSAQVIDEKISVITFWVLIDLSGVIKNPFEANSLETFFRFFRSTYLARNHLFKPNRKCQQINRTESD